MHIIVKNISSFETFDYIGVTSIGYASNTYTIVNGDGTYTFSDDDYIIHIIYT